MLKKIFKDELTKQFTCLQRVCKKNLKEIISCSVVVLLAKMLVSIQPLILGIIVDSLKDNQLAVNSRVLILLSLFAAVGFLSSIFFSLKESLMLSTRESFRRVLSTELMKKLQKFSHSFFYKRNASQIFEINNIGIDAVYDFIANLFLELLPFIFELVLVFAIISIKFNLLISISVFVTLALYIFIALHFALREMSFIEQIKDSRIKMASQFYENITNFENVKIMRAEKERLNSFVEVLKQSFNVYRKYKGLILLKSFLQNFVLYFGLFCTLLASLVSSLNKQLSTGNFVMVSTYFFQLFFPLMNILRAYINFKKSIVNIKPLMELLLREPDLVVYEPVYRLEMKSINIKFKNVSFNYEMQPILTDISFTISPQKRIALVGPTGGGKSTIGKLLLRFYDPTLGSIKINNYNIKNISFSNLRSLIGYVSQETILLQDSILNNIIMNQSNIDMEFLYSLARQDNILDFVPDLECGFDTIVGDRGLKLSGGQRQRIMIARALIRKPKLLVLDEYNSALDIHTETRIHRYIINMGCSILMISHRLNNVVDCDEILVIKSGKIIERGSHDYLIRNHGWYQKTWKLYKYNRQHTEFNTDILTV